MKFGVILFFLYLSKFVFDYKKVFFIGIIVMSNVVVVLFNKK